MQRTRFSKAKPIWLTGLSEEMNIQAGFRATFGARRGEHRLRIAGASVYRIYLNGQFIGHGPARCGHGYYRVDEWQLPVVSGANLIAIEAAGYNANGYAYLDQPSFIQAEIVAGESVLAATGTAQFSAYRLAERIQKVQRYSFQRAFVEAYRLSPRSSDWRMQVKHARKSAATEVLADRKLVPRGVPYPRFETRQPVAIAATGTMRPLRNPKLRTGREWTGPRDDFKAFPANRQTLYPSHELESLATRTCVPKRKAFDPHATVTLRPNRFTVYDLGVNLTGFIGLAVECAEPVDLYVTFDELAMDDGDVSILRYHCANVVKYQLKPGRYELETLEPYTLKYLKLIALRGSCEISGLYLREYACPDSDRGQFAASDHRLGDLFEAARQTFRQNAVDIFMDCPGRERAGWLCDSFFTARAEASLCGGNPIERNFFENYLLPKRYPHMAKGMLPMCYPADHSDGWYIPNWAMWFVIELEEYLRRSGNRGMVDGLRPKVYGLIEHFKAYLNGDGLLEHLDKWIFIEWSEAAKFVQDVSYPTNMLYAGMLDAAGRLYDDTKLLAQAKSVRQRIRAQSFDGEFFVDNAVRADDGSLTVTRNRTETCQYYAFYFDVATPKSHPELWRKLLTDFGPQRDARKHLPEVHPSNAFIGFFLRLDVLSQYGQHALVLDQLHRSYLPMAETTGTLWEHKDTSASCNHGFAAHVAHILYRDVLGVTVDRTAKRVRFDPPDVPLDWCSGRIPVGDDYIDAKWVRHGKRVTRTISVPRGFTVA